MINLANILTGSRILFSLILLFCPVFSIAFYVIYITCGITDMIDGAAARKMGTESSFGSKLDTLSDLIFILAAAYKILPALDIPLGIWIWAGGIAIIKFISLISGFVLQKQFLSLHTFANKGTGLLLFLFPLFLPVIPLTYSLVLICAAATFAAIEEGYLIWTRRKL